MSIIIRKFPTREFNSLETIRPANAGFGIRGEVRAILYDLNLRPVQDTGWTPNVITNLGMERGGWATGGIGAYMNIGFGTSTPSVTDTTLGNWQARVSASVAGIISPTAPDYALSMQRAGRFNPGVATGTVSEMGLSTSNLDNPTNLGVRALLSPAIAKGVDNYLDVYHRLWMYPPLTDSTGQFLIDGELFDVTIRPFRIAGSHYSENIYGNWTCTGSSIGTYGYPSPLIAIDATALTYDGGSQNSFPDGINKVSSGGSGPWWNEVEVNLDLTKANFANGIANTSWGVEHHTCNLQMHFARVSDGLGVPKLNTQTFRMRLRTSATRYVP